MLTQSENTEQQFCLGQKLHFIQIRLVFKLNLKALLYTEHNRSKYTPVEFSLKCQTIQKCITLQQTN